LRRPASVDAGARLRGSRQNDRVIRCPEDVDSVFSGLYERNRQWQRDRDARVEQLGEEDIARQMTAPPTPRTMRARSCEPGVLRSSSESARTPRHAPSAVAPVTRSEAEQTDPDTNVLVPSEASSKPCMGASSDLPCQPPLQPPKLGQFLPGQPVRVLRQQPSVSAAEGGECAEVMDHLQALKRCLLSSQNRNSGTWQRTVRIDSSRLSGAGAAPIRATPLHSVPQHSLSSPSLAGPSLALTPRLAERGRTRSPAMDRCRKLQPGMRCSIPARGAHSRDPSPVVAERVQGRTGSPITTPRSARALGSRRPSYSPAPPHPRPSSMGPRVSPA